MSEPERRRWPFCNMYELICRPTLESLKDISEESRKENAKLTLLLTQNSGKMDALNTRINGSFEKIASFIESGVWWRRAIIGVVITIVLQATGGLIVAVQLGSSYGKNQRQIEVNTQRLNVIESNLSNERKKP